MGTDWDWAECGQGTGRSEKSKDDGEKGEGPGTTLAWSGWKHNEISVKVDWHDSKKGNSREAVYYCTFSSEFENTLTVYCTQ